jgi:hypothetical protein
MHMIVMQHIRSMHERVRMVISIIMVSLVVIFTRFLFIETCLITVLRT